MSKPPEIEVLPWYIEAADDGLKKPCILVATLHDHELVSVSLHVSEPPVSEEA